MSFFIYICLKRVDISPNSDVNGIGNLEEVPLLALVDEEGGQRPAEGDRLEVGHQAVQLQGEQVTLISTDDL